MCVCMSDCPKNKPTYPQQHPTQHTHTHTHTQLGFPPQGTTGYYSGNATKVDAAAVQAWLDSKGVSAYVKGKMWMDWFGFAWALGVWVVWCVVVVLCSALARFAGGGSVDRPADRPMCCSLLHPHTHTHTPTTKQLQHPPVQGGAHRRRRRQRRRGAHVRGAAGGGPRDGRGRGGGGGAAGGRGERQGM